MLIDDLFFVEIVKRGWLLQPRTDLEEENPLLANLPPELKGFLCSFGTLINQAETVWLNSARDFAVKSNHGFSWNEFEAISLAAAEGDADWQKDVRSFWSDHVPILMSVESRYDYVAYCKSGSNGGRYVRGCEPEFEQVEVVASSLAEFKSWLLQNIV